MTKIVITTVLIICLAFRIVYTHIMIGKPVTRDYANAEELIDVFLIVNLVLLVFVD